MTIVVLDLHLLEFEFKETKSQSHMLQTGAVTAAATAAGTMILFSLFQQSVTWISSRTGVCYFPACSGSQTSYM